jgi:GDSL-like lipase/acylhydrolase family protein
VRRSGSSPLGRGRWANALLLSASTLAGLLLAEATLRVARLPRRHTRHTNPSQFLPMPEKGYLYTNLPSSEITFVYEGNPRGYFRPDNSVVHTTNSKGFRGPEFSVAKPPGTLRFLFLGDSFTFGEGVKDADTYPERFRRLAADSFAYPGRRVESINLGVGGYDTRQEAALLRDFGLLLSPDRIIVGYCLNDAEPPIFRRDEGGKLVRRSRAEDAVEDLADQSPPFPMDILRLTRLAYQVYDGFRATRMMIGHYRELYREDGENWRNTRRALSDISEMGKGRGVRVTLLIFPIFYRLDSRYPFAEIHARVAREAEGAGIEVLDLLPLFRNYSGEELWVDPTDQHPNEIVHEKVAGKLLEYLLGRPDPDSPSP